MSKYIYNTNEAINFVTGEKHIKTAVSVSNHVNCY